jgi:RNA polymerase sigma-70 factor (ECF subfamily)
MAHRAPPPRPPPSPERLSFTALFERHFDDVRRVIERHGVPERDAEDVAQEVFVILHREIDALDTSTSLRPWLEKVARRKARDYLARDRARPASPSQLDALLAPLNLEQSVNVADARRLVLQLLDELDHERREVFVMHVFDEMSASEIAEELGIPVGTVKTRIKSARERLEAAWNRRRAQERHALGLGLLSLGMLDLDALLELEKPILEAPIAARERVWSRLVDALGPSAPSAGTSSGGTGRVALSAQQLAGSVALAFVIGGGMGAATIAWLGSRAPASVPITIAPAAEVVTARVEAAPPIVPSATPSVVATASAGPVDAGAVASTTETDLLLIQSAARALEQGNPDLALRKLERHARVFENSDLAATREQLRAQAMAYKEAQKSKAKTADAGQPR